jgi:peptide/nickel transport system ATP-binding protein
MTDAVLQIEELHVGVDTPEGTVPLVRGASLTLRRGARAALVGESGSGKSLTSLAVMGLNAPPTRVTGGAIRLGELDLATAGEHELRQVRGARVAMVYQDPLSSLNPVKTIGAQLAEAITTHGRMPRDAARARAVELLDAVGLSDPERRCATYPHELSGGMRQRVVIAMAIAARPEVLIADEPTTALDVTTQARILDLLARLSRELDMAVLLITHDLAVAAGFCDEVNVMYAGRVVERAPVRDVFGNPRHPYTRALLGSICTLDLDPASAMPAIGGQPPQPGQLPSGCPFHPRCPRAHDTCVGEPPPTVVDEAGRLSECVLAVEEPVR